MEELKLEDNDQYNLLNPNAMTFDEKMRLDKWIPPEKDEVQNKTNEMRDLIKLSIFLVR